MVHRSSGYDLEIKVLSFTSSGRLREEPKRCTVAIGTAGYTFMYKGGLCQAIIMQPGSPANVIIISYGRPRSTDFPWLNPPPPVFGEVVRLAIADDSGRVLAYGTALHTETKTLWEYRLTTQVHLVGLKSLTNRLRYRFALITGTVAEWAVGLPGFGVYAVWLIAEKASMSKLSAATSNLMDCMSETLDTFRGKVYAAKIYLR